MTLPDHSMRMVSDQGLLNAGIDKTNTKLEKTKGERASRIEKEPCVVRGRASLDYV